jgi:hypothetical protein
MRRSCLLVSRLCKLLPGEVISRSSTDWREGIILHPSPCLPHKHTNVLKHLWILKELQQ